MAAVVSELVNYLFLPSSNNPTIQHSTLRAKMSWHRRVATGFSKVREYSKKWWRNCSLVKLPFTSQRPGLRAQCALLAPVPDAALCCTVPSPSKPATQGYRINPRWYMNGEGCVGVTPNSQLPTSRQASTQSHREKANVCHSAIGEQIFQYNYLTVVTFPW